MSARALVSKRAITARIAKGRQHILKRESNGLDARAARRQSIGVDLLAEQRRSSGR
jgi:hypothetical protein